MDLVRAPVFDRVIGNGEFAIGKTQESKLVARPEAMAALYIQATTQTRPLDRGRSTPWPRSIRSAIRFWSMLVLPDPWERSSRRDSPGFARSV